MIALMQKMIILIHITASILSTFVLAADIPPTPVGISLATGIPPGYSRSEIVWSGFEGILEGSSDHPTTTTKFTGLRLTGTIESVLSQLEHLGFPIDRLFDDQVYPEHTGCQGDDDPYPPTDNRSRVCGVGGMGPVAAPWLEDQAKYLSGLNWRVKCGNPDVKTCGPMICDDQASSGIWFCNGPDNTRGLHYPCKLFAPYAMEIHDHCQDEEGNPTWVRGEVREDTLMFRVMVGRTWEGIVGCHSKPTTSIIV